jgi:hypothetical protein
LLGSQLHSTPLLPVLLSLGFISMVSIF